MGIYCATYSNHVHLLHETVPSGEDHFGRELPGAWRQAVLEVVQKLGLVRFVRVLVGVQHIIGDAYLLHRLVRLALEQVDRLQELAGASNHQVVQLLQEDNDSRRSAVVLRVGPQQANGVKHGIERGERIRRVELHRFQRLEVARQWLQMSVNVVRLLKCRQCLFQQLLKGRVIAALSFL